MTRRAIVLGAAALAVAAVVLLLVRLPSVARGPRAGDPAVEGPPAPPPRRPPPATPSPRPTPRAAPAPTHGAPSPAPAGATPERARWDAGLDEPDTGLDDQGSEDEAFDAPEPSVWPLSREGIQGAVGEATPGMRRCYAEALARDPQLAGRMSLGFTVTDQDGVGKVTVVELEDGAITDDPMIDCVLASFEELQFDAPLDGQLSVTYPMVFSPDDE